MRKGQIRVGITERENTVVKADQDETAPCRAHKHLIIAQIVRGAVSARRRKRRKARSPDTGERMGSSRIGHAERKHLTGT